MSGSPTKYCNSNMASYLLLKTFSGNKEFHVNVNHCEPQGPLELNAAAETWSCHFNECSIQIHFMCHVQLEQVCSDIPRSIGHCQICLNRNNGYYDKKNQAFRTRPPWEILGKSDWNLIGRTFWISKVHKNQRRSMKVSGSHPFFCNATGSPAARAVSPLRCVDGGAGLTENFSPDGVSMRESVSSNLSSKHGFNKCQIQESPVSFCKCVWHPTKKD